MVEYVGIALALVAALGLASQALFIRIGTQRGRSHDALAIVLTVNLVTLIPLTLVVEGPEYGLTPYALAAFVAAGFVGTMLGRAFLYAGIERIGASRAEPIKASMPLYASILAVIVLGETLTAGHLTGTVLIVAGVGLISWVSANDSAPDAQQVPLHHLGLPLAAAFFFGVEPVFAKMGLATGTPVLVGLTIKVVAAALGFAAYLWWRDALPTAAGLRGGSLGWYAAAGAANTTFLLSYYAALQAAPIVLVVPIIQMSPLVVMLLSVVFLQRLERVTPRLALGAVFVVAGAVMVSVFG